MRNTKNPARSFQSAIVLVLGIGVLLPSCSKDESEPETPTVPTGGTQNQFYLVTGQTPEDSLVAAFHWAEKSLTFNYYGLKDPGGTVASIYSASLRKDGSDTSHIFMLNGSGKVASYYSEMDGTKDSTVLKFSYQDTLVIVSAYHMDWLTNTIVLREQVVVRTEDGSVLSVVRGGGGLYAAQTHARLTADAVLAGVGIVIGLAAAVAEAPILVAVGSTLAATGILNAQDFSMEALNALHLLLDAAFNNASASEVDAIPIAYFNATNNPQVSIDFISSNPSNEQWSWCAFAMYFLHPHGWYIDWQGTYSNFTDYDTRLIAEDYLVCDTVAIENGGDGFIVTVRPGGWVTLIQQEASGGCGLPIGLQRTAGSFACP